VDLEPTEPHGSPPDRVLIEAQRMDLVGRLAPGISHELANPFSALMAFSTLIATDARLPADVRADAEAVGRQAELAHLRTRALLDFVRHRPPERHPTSLLPLVQSVIDLLSYALTARSIDVAVVVDPELPPVPLDRPMVQQALFNLVLNSLDALDLAGGGRITIRASARSSGLVRLEVIDDGPGPDRSLGGSIYEPAVTTRGGDHRGLGLPVARSIAEAHGGTLSHEPGADGRGVVFAVDLPLEAQPRG
jgi:two-component system sensor histidine kinase HydH